MPRISFFYGIGIWMYWNEGVHSLPHFHARYGQHAATVGLDGRMIAGSLPKRAHALVMAWTALHHTELAENWQRARRHEPLLSIDPLP